MVDTDLTKYVKDGLLKGYTKEELKKILLENEWSEKEISNAMAIAVRSIAREQPKQKIKEEELKAKQPKPQFAKTVEPTTKTKATVISPSQERLLKFIKTALGKGITKDQIKSALKQRGWPEYKIIESFNLVESQRAAGAAKEAEKPKKEEKIARPHSKITFSVIMSYLVSFVLITVVLTATISLLFYVISITEYEVIDPTTGETVKGECLEEKCTDMKEFGFQKVKDQLPLSLRIAAISAFIIVLAYGLLPFKTALLWIINLLYFVFIVYISYLWIRFNYVTIA